MADDSTQIKERVSHLERRVAELGGNVRAEATARASMQRDINGLKAAQGMQQRLIDASNEQRDQLKALEAKVDTRFDQMETRVDSLQVSFDARVDALESSVTSRFDAVDARFEQVDRRFEQVDARFDAVDARFEQVDKRFDAVDARFEQMDTRFDKMDTRFDRLETNVQAILDRLGPPPGGDNSQN